MIQQTHASALWYGVYHKKILIIAHSIISTTQHITIRQFLLNPTTSYSARVLMESTKRDRHAAISIRAFLIEWHDSFSLAGSGHRITGKGLKTWNRATSRHDQIFYCTNVYVTPRPSTQHARWSHLLKEIWRPWFPFMHLPSNDMTFSIWYGHQITRKFLKIIKTAFWGPNTWPGHQCLLQITISHSAHLLGPDTYSKRYDNHIFHSCDSLHMIWHLVSGRSIETPLEVLKDFHTAVSCQEQQVRLQSMMNIHTYIAFNHRRSKKMRGDSARETMKYFTTTRIYLLHISNYFLLTTHTFSFWR